MKSILLVAAAALVGFLSTRALRSTSADIPRVPDLPIVGQMVHVDMVELGFDEIVDVSTDIVHAEIGPIESVDVGPDGLVRTRYRIYVFDWVKASDENYDSIQYLEVGGGQFTLEGQTVESVVAGAPKFENGQECILFLWRESNGAEDAFGLVGLSQGAYPILVNPETQAAQPYGAHAADTESVADFKARIQAALVP